MGNGIHTFSPRLPLDRQLNAGKLNRIVRELDSLAIRKVVGGSFRKTPGGTEIVIGRSSGGGASAPFQPWDLVAQVDPDAGPEDETPPYLVRVRPGTANGILPSNWDIEEECAGTGLFYGKAVIATDGEAITGVTIEIDVTPPTVQQPVEFGIATSVEYLFGLFSEGQVYRVIGAGQIVLATSTWLVTSANPAAGPGESPYDIYYLLGP